MSTIPFTVDGQDIPADAPRSMMTDQQAADLSDAAAEFRAVAMHLHSDLVGRDVTLTASNCPPGLVACILGDGAADIEQRIAEGETPTVTHTYPSDGVFTASLAHENGERADLEIAINFPPPDPIEEVPAP
jgi:hypothetical protein